jgi:DNA-binding NarL/FixJ family response regulator
MTSVSLDDPVGLRGMAQSLGAEDSRLNPSHARDDWRDMEATLDTLPGRNDRHDPEVRDVAHVGGAVGHQPINRAAIHRDSVARASLSERRRSRPHLRVVGAAERTSAYSDTPVAPVRVLIADAQALVRAGYRMLLESAAGIEVVAEAGNAQQAVARARETAPDVALVDQRLPGFDDPDAIAALAAHPAFTRVAVMLVTSGDSEERVVSALRAGAVGVVGSDDPPATLIESVRLLARGQALLPAGAVRRLFGELRPRLSHHTALTGHLEDLTEREREVVALAAEGLTNGEIAARLVISPATAKTHVSRAMIKLHVRHRAALVVSAYEHGLVVPSELSTSYPGARLQHEPTCSR